MGLSVTEASPVESLEALALRWLERLAGAAAQRSVVVLRQLKQNRGRERSPPCPVERMMVQARMKVVAASVHSVACLG